MIFFTTHTYALGWAMGIDEASEELHRQIANPDAKSLPVVRTIARLRTLDELCIWTDSGSTRIAESRSRAFHQALHSGADVWFACDDDCEATLDALRCMVEAVRGRNGVCIAPYWARLARDRLPGINCNLPQLAEGESHPVRELKGGGKVIPCNYGGMGLVTMSRKAMMDTADANEGNVYNDQEGTIRLAMFLEFIDENGFWLGEDLAFFRRLPPSVAVEALITGHTMHNGNMLDLSVIANGIPILEPTLETFEPAPQTQH
jgi:hypothetical protein